MSRIPAVLQNLRLPVIGSPLFIISNPQLVIAQCKAGIVGSLFLGLLIFLDTPLRIRNHAATNALRQCGCDITQ